MGRLIVFDQRGTGLSDRVTGTPTLEERAADVEAVMDATGSQHATLIGWGADKEEGRSHPEAQRQWRPI